MKKNTYIAIVVGVAVVLALIALALMQKNNKDSEMGTNLPNGKMVTGSDQETFSGTITAVDTSCFSDGICSVSVDGKKVILVQGGRGLPPDTKVGRLIGVDSIGDLEQKIGAHANVYAAPTNDGNYTLYGNDTYYVEVVTLKN